LYLFGTAVSRDDFFSLIVLYNAECF